MGGAVSCDGARKDLRILRLSAPVVESLASRAAILLRMRTSRTPRSTVVTSPVPIADPGSTLPSGWQYGAMYEVFVRAFRDSDGDGAGDLRGLIEKLDYLQELGVTGLWLMPVMHSADHDHGYAITDYRDIEPEYGTLHDFDALLSAAHQRGIGVILDYVMNHSSSEHPSFLESRSSRSSMYRDWYVWANAHPEGWNIYGNDPWHDDATGSYFGAFWGQMPDWNLRNRAVVAWHHDNLRFWLNRGIDGFRFDAVGNLIEDDAQNYQNESGSYQLVAQIESLLDCYTNRYMVVEAPTDPIGFANVHPGGSAFAFGHHRDLIEAARGDTRALELVAGFPPVAPPSIATILSNHDSFAGQRVCDQLGGNLAMMKLAAAMYLLQPGVPFIYYGEEIGMAGCASDSVDQSLRAPMSWTAEGDGAGFTRGTPFRALASNVATNNVAAQQVDPDSLYNFYRAMLALRRNRPSLARGTYEGAQVTDAVMSFRRERDGEETVVVINVGWAPASVSLSGLRAGARYSTLWPEDAVSFVAGPDGGAAGEMPAQSVRVFGRVG
jgi:alpha-amylase